jgi:capsular exopolysaccharide synthesis family protein
MMRGSADFNLRYALRALRRRLPLFLSCVLIVPAAAVAVSVVQKKKYTATASLFFRDPQFAQMVFGTSLAPAQVDPTRQAATNLDLVSLPRVAALTADRLHMTEQQVESAVTESNMGQSDLVTIQATARSPGLAAKLATTFANEYIAFRRDADRSTILSAEHPLQQQIASLPPTLLAGSFGQSLQSRLGQLRVLASLETGNAELVQAAEVPRGPSSPKPIRNGALGLFFGIVLGLGLIVLGETLDRRLRDPDEVEQIFERPVLAMLPESDELKGADPALLGIPEAEREALRMLWTNLRYFTLSRDIHSVLVTSADRGDGKSTVAWGIGIAAASAGRRTLLVEADLRSPSVARRLKVPPRAGLTSTLTGDATFDEAIVRVPLGRGEDGSNAARSMDVLCAGPRPPDPADLLQSHWVADFLTWLTDRYELIVIDTAPATVVSDTIPLITLVDGVVVVCKLGHTVRDHARRLRQQFDHLDAPVLGVVVNSLQEDGQYEYPYGYEYDPRSFRTSSHANGARARSEIQLASVPGSSREPGHENGHQRGGREGSSAGRLPPSGSD